MADEAVNLVTGDRNRDYDHPSKNHTQTAELWSAFLSRKLSAPITAREVCWMQVLLKASRDSYSDKHDNIVDAIGYLLNVEMLDEGDMPKLRKTMNTPTVLDEGARRRDVESRVNFVDPEVTPYAILHDREWGKAALCDDEGCRLCSHRKGRPAPPPHKPPVTVWGDKPSDFTWDKE